MSVFMGVPTMYAYLLEACATRMDQSQRSAARYAVSTHALLTASIFMCMI